MKILLVTGNYLPGKNGGIENYTHWLATLLSQNQNQVEVAALNVNEENDYYYEGVKVNCLEGSIYTFENLLRNAQYDICHFHEYSENGGIEIPWFIKAKEYCRKVFFTFHLPYFTCYKGDFRYKGIADCNNFSNPDRCVECILSEKLGYKNSNKITIKNKLIDFSIPLLRTLPQLKKIKRNIIRRRKQLNQLIDICDNVFVIADWFKQILNENGFTSEKIIKIPPFSKLEIATRKTFENSIKNKICFVGRIEEQKGLHLLCEAMNQIETVNLRLDVYGNIKGQAYFDNCIKIFTFNYLGVLPRKELLTKINNYDFIILPSVCTEMFSMIAQESLYDHVPVIASDAKGNREMIREGENGFLFTYGDSMDLANTIDNAYRLKQDGWFPKFPIIGEVSKNEEEIISFYF